MLAEGRSGMKPIRYEMKTVSFKRGHLLFNARNTVKIQIFLITLRVSISALLQDLRNAIP